MKHSLFITLLAILYSAGFPDTAISDTLKIVHFDVGKGDATLIVSPDGTTVLIDAGSETVTGDSIAQLISGYLTGHGITSLDYTIATHFHQDHINAFIPLFNDYGYLPQTAFDRGAPGVDSSWYNCGCYDDYIEYVENASVRDSIFAGDLIDLGDGAVLTVIYANGVFINGREDNLRYQHYFENIRCVCLLLEYGSFRYVVAGDLTGTGGFVGDKETPAAALIGDIDVFQVNHHGGNSSTNQNWLDLLRPEAAVVSNNYSMVSQNVLDRIDDCETMQSLYHTEDSANLGVKSIVVGGNVIIETDGLEYYTAAGDSFSLADVPSVAVTATPDPLHVIIPPGGGTFSYELALTNNTGETAVFDVWTKWHYQGVWHTSFGPQQLTLPPYGSITRTRTASLPGGVNPGNYAYEVRVGNHPDTVWHASSFPVWKSPADDALATAGLINDPKEIQVTPNEPEKYSPSLSTHPNPFNPVTTITFTLTEPGRARLSIYDVSGRLTAELLNDYRTAGEHHLTFDGFALPSGIYFVTLQTPRTTITRKFLLIK